MWLVLPDKRRIDVFTEDGPTSYTESDRISGGHVLPGLMLGVRDVFSQLD